MITMWTLVAAFCGYVFFAGVRKLVSFVYAPFLILSFFILVAYANGFTHTLPAVKYSFFYGGILAGAAGLVECVRKFPQLWAEARWREEFCIFLLFMALLFFFTGYYSATPIFHWDEFFHAAYGKALFYEKGFWTIDSLLARTEVSMTYPPMTALLAWLFLPMQAFEEAAFSVASAVFFVSIACAVYGILRSRVDIFSALVITVLVMTFVRTMGVLVTEYYITAYADATQGALLTLGLCTLFYMQETKERIWIVIGVVLLLSICKATGFVLSVYLAAAMGLQQLLQRKGIVGAVKMGLFLFVLACIPFGIWKMYVNTYIPGLSSSGALLNLHELVADPFLTVALKAQWQAFIHRPLLFFPFGDVVGFATSACAFLSIISLGMLVVMYKKESKNIAFLWHMLLLFMGLLGWFFLHFYGFFIFNTENLIVSANSFERYIGIFVGSMWCFFLMYFLLYVIKEKYRTVFASTLCILMLILVVFPLQRPFPNSLPDFMVKMRNAAGFLEGATPLKSVIFTIWADKRDPELWALRYYAAPQRKVVYPYEHTNTYIRPRAKLERPSLPSKEKVWQDIGASGADYLFIYDDSVFMKYPDYFTQCAHKVPCLLPLEN